MGTDNKDEEDWFRDMMEESMKDMQNSEGGQQPQQNFSTNNFKGSTDQLKDDTEVAPVTLGKKATGAVLIGIAIAFIFVFLMFGRLFTGSSKRNSDNVNSTNGVSLEASGATGNSSNNVGENSENSSFSSSSVSGSDVSAESGNFSSEIRENSNSSADGNREDLNSTPKESSSGTVRDSFENTESSDDIPAQADNGSSNEMIAVDEDPVFDSTGNMSGLVADKKVFWIDDLSYVYRLDIALTIGDGKTITVKYYCPGKTYEALQVGEAVNVSYGVDKDGYISIESISK